MNSLDDWLWRWSIWCENGTAKQQVTSWLKESTGVYSSGAAFEDDVGCGEYKIETIVSALAEADAIAAKVLRTEYLPRWQGKLQGDRALMMDMTLRTYQRKLQKAKLFISERFFT